MLCTTSMRQKGWGWGWVISIRQPQGAPKRPTTLAERKACGDRPSVPNATNRIFKFYPPKRAPPRPTPPTARFKSTAQYSAGGAPARQPSCFGGEDHGDRCVGMIATNRIFRVPSKPPPFLRSPSPASTDRSHLSYRPTRPQVWLPSAAPLAKSCRILKKSEGFRMYSSYGSASVFASTGFRRSVATKPEVAAASASAKTGHRIAKIRSPLPIAKICTHAWGLAKIRR